MWPNLGEPVIENNCDLVGVFGIFVQLVLVLLVFSAVKCKRELTSKTSFRKTKANPEAFFHGWYKTTAFKRNASCS